MKEDSSVLLVHNVSVVFMKLLNEKSGAALASSLATLAAPVG